MPSLLPVLLSLVLFAPAALAGHVLAPAPLGPPSYPQQAPLVAFAGDRFLTVWVESMDLGGSRILGAFSDREGNRLSPAAFVIATHTTFAPIELLGTGDSFALFVPVIPNAVMMEIDLEGHVTATRTVGIQRYSSVLQFEWNGSRFVTAENGKAVFFNRDGNVTDRVTLMCHASVYELMRAGTEVIAASVCSGTLRVERIASDGGVVRAIVDSHPAAYDVRIAATAMPDGGLLVAWGSSAVGQTLKTAKISADGTRSEPHLLGADAGVYTPLQLTKTANGYLLAYVVDGDLYSATLDHDGALVSIDDAPTGGYGRPASAASDGGNILVADVEFESSASRGRVRTRLLRPGAPIAPATLVSIVPARQHPPVLGATSGGQLVAAWTEQQGLTSRVRAALLAADGTPLSDATVESNAKLVSHDLAWNGTHFLTVTARDGQLRAQRINAFGERTGSGRLLKIPTTPRAPRAAVVWAGNHWEIAATDGQNAFRATVAADGTLTSSAPLRLEGPLAEEMVRIGITDVALAWDGSRTYVGWIEEQYMPCSFECIAARPAFLARIDRTSELVPLGESWSTAETLSLASNGDAIVAALSRYGLGTETTSFDTALQKIASRGFDGAADVLWDGTTFVFALLERDRLTVRRLDERLIDAARARTTDVGPADTPLSAPSVATAVIGNAVIGIQELDANSGARAIAYAEQELDLEPQRRRTVRR